jgi:hypothetical protein
MSALHLFMPGQSADSDNDAVEEIVHLELKSSVGSYTQCVWLKIKSFLSAVTKSR